MWRRFDLILRFPRPSKIELQAYARKMSARFQLKSKQAMLKRFASAKTYADAEKLVEAEARRIALEGSSSRMSTNGRTIPRTFYLNEQHELTRAEKEGGGRIPQYIDINWASKGTAISRSLNRVRGEIQESPDPAKENHYFVLAAPVERLTKASKDKTKAKDGKVFEDTDFSREHSRVFRRLGVDLLDFSAADDGSAVVHMKPEMMEQLSSRAQSLAKAGRWGAGPLGDNRQVRK